MKIIKFKNNVTMYEKNVVKNLALNELLKSWFVTSPSMNVAIIVFWFVDLVAIIDNYDLIERFSS